MGQLVAATPRTRTGTATGATGRARPWLASTAPAPRPRTPCASFAPWLGPLPSMSHRLLTKKCMFWRAYSTLFSRVSHRKMNLSYSAFSSSCSFSSSSSDCLPTVYPVLIVSHTHARYRPGGPLANARLHAVLGGVAQGQQADWVRVRRAGAARRGGDPVQD
jgi:hypothetical protein